MKKISAVVLSLIFVVIFAFGCTYADKATLNTINTKYESLTKNEQYKDIIFKGKYLALTYNGNINSAITNPSDTLNEKSRKFTLLKTSSNVEDYLNCSYYGLLSYAVNIIYISNLSTLSSPANNEKVSQDIKTEMYKYLDALEKNVKDLKVQKEFLESVFNNDSRDFQQIVETSLTQDTLNEYLDSLNKTLFTMLSFNDKAFEALQNIQPRNLEDINSLTEFTNSDINSLIANAVLLISNYILRFDINLKDDLVKETYDATLINLLKDILNLTKKNYNGNEDATKLVDFKLICADENGLINNQKIFKKAINNLSKNDLLESELSTSVEAKLAIVEEYKMNLIGYLNKLIGLLNSF